MGLPADAGRLMRRAPKYETIQYKKSHHEKY